MAEDQFGDAVLDVAVSRNGARAAVPRSTGNLDLWLYELRGESKPEGPEVVAGSTFNDAEAEISPDGRRLAFISVRSGRRQVWMCGLDGSNLRQLTFGDEVRRGPNWESDSRTIRYGTRNGDVRRFYRMDVTDGTPRFERDDFYIEHGTPDGKWQFGRRAIGDQDKLFRIAADGRVPPTPVTRRVNFYSLFAGDWIYFVDRNSGDAKLWRLPVRGGVEEEVTPSVTNGAFAVTADHLYFARRIANRRWGVYMQMLGTAQPRLLFEITNRPNRKLTVSKDGRRMVLDVAVQEGADIMVADLSWR